VAAFVAADEESGQIVGAVIFGPSSVKPDGAETEEVFALGVMPERRRRYIGTDLKLSVMADASARGVPLVISFVHKGNYQMNNLNAKIGVETSDWADDEYHLTAVLLELDSNEIDG
jgi:ribosomal protein S18 acetylase RimI-like enzyme